MPHVSAWLRSSRFRPTLPIHPVGTPGVAGRNSPEDAAAPCAIAAASDRSLRHVQCPVSVPACCPHPPMSAYGSCSVVQSTTSRRRCPPLRQTKMPNRCVKMSLTLSLWPVGDQLKDSSERQPSISGQSPPTALYALAARTYLSNTCEHAL